MSDQPAVLDGAVPPGENTHFVGHEKTIEFLTRTYRGGELHHALLLEGPHGIGKATLGFRFARHILSHPDPGLAPELMSDGDPDDPILKQLASGASHDLLHLTRPVDPKTGRVKTAITVDEVRRVGRFFSQTSGTGNWRIVIIDSADDMNRAAANALLKVLEEPPEKSLFVLISHASGRLLPTIRSRCMPIRMAPLSEDEVRMGLSFLNLDQGENPDTIEAVIKQSGGSLATAILLLRYGGVDIAEAVEQIFQDGPVNSTKAVHALADTLTAKDREIAYGFFSDYLLDRIGQMARNHALSGDLNAADQWAHEATKVRETLQTAQTYNLDRKQTIISLFSSVFRMSAA